MRGQQVEVTLQAATANGKLISFIERHSLVRSRDFVDGRVTLTALMGKQTLTDLSRNEQVEIVAVKDAVGEK